MPTRYIPRDEWTSFFDGFSLQHREWLVSIEVLSSDIGAQVEAREVPLQGITADLRDGGEDIISIIVGRIPEEHLTHNIYAPTHVRLKQTKDGADEALEIESPNLVTLLRFRSAVLPEMVDGIL